MIISTRGTHMIIEVVLVEEVQGTYTPKVKVTTPFGSPSNYTLKPEN